MKSLNTCSLQSTVFGTVEESKEEGDVDLVYKFFRSIAEFSGTKIIFKKKQ